MATVRKTITLTNQQDDWIKAQVEGGDYTNDSEYIRDLIRREQERGAEIEVVRAALIEGEKSGKPKRFDESAFKRKLKPPWLRRLTSLAIRRPARRRIEPLRSAFESSSPPDIPVSRKNPVQHPS